MNSSCKKSIEHWTRPSEGKNVCQSLKYNVEGNKRIQRSNYINRYMIERSEIAGKGVNNE